MYRLQHLYLFVSAVFRLIRGILALLWTALRPAARFVGALIGLVAVIALVSDITRWQTGPAEPIFSSLLLHLKTMAPTSLEALSASVARAIHPIAWDPLLAGILSMPAWIIFAVVAFGLLYASRERRKTNIFIN